MHRVLGFLSGEKVPRQLEAQSQAEENAPGAGCGVLAYPFRVFLEIVAAAGIEGVLGGTGRILSGVSKESEIFVALHPVGVVNAPVLFSRLPR